MNLNRSEWTATEFEAAVTRGVHQIVFIGSQALSAEELERSSTLDVFAVDEEQRSEMPGTFVPTNFDSEALATALSRSNFDRLKATLFVWIGEAKYRTIDAALATLSFVASLPKGSGVLFDYNSERTSPSPCTGRALDVLASKISIAGGAVKHLIQPQAMESMLRALGFDQMMDQSGKDCSCETGHLVSAAV